MATRPPADAPVEPGALVRSVLALRSASSAARWSRGPGGSDADLADAGATPASDLFATSRRSTLLRCAAGGGGERADRRSRTAVSRHAQSACLQILLRRAWTRGEAARKVRLGLESPRPARRFVEAHLAGLCPGSVEKPLRRLDGDPRHAHIHGSDRLPESDAWSTGSSMRRRRTPGLSPQVRSLLKKSIRASCCVIVLPLPNPPAAGSSRCRSTAARRSRMVKESPISAARRHGRPAAESHAGEPGLRTPIGPWSAAISATGIKVDCRLRSLRRSSSG